MSIQPGSHGRVSASALNYIAKLPHSTRVRVGVSTDNLQVA
jgi:hypothetical protein